MPVLGYRAERGVLIFRRRGPRSEWCGGGPMLMCGRDEREQHRANGKTQCLHGHGCLEVTAYAFLQWQERVCSMWLKRVC